MKKIFTCCLITCFLFVGLSGNAAVQEKKESWSDFLRKYGDPIALGVTISTVVGIYFHERNRMQNKRIKPDRWEDGPDLSRMMDRPITFDIGTSQPQLLVRPKSPSVLALEHREMLRLSGRRALMVKSAELEMRQKPLVSEIQDELLQKPKKADTNQKANSGLLFEFEEHYLNDQIE